MFQLQGGREKVGGKKEYLKKSKKNHSIQNLEKPQWANIPGEAKALLLYED